MTPHIDSAQKIIEELSSDLNLGLSQAAAKKKLSENGKNKLDEAKKVPLILRFLGQFKDILILILIGAAIISFVLALVERHYNEFLEPGIIMLIVIANAILGLVQESRAEKALEALKKMSAPHARVIRDGVETVVSSEELVVGDIVLLEAGDFVPADCRLLTSSSLKCEESALTGESVDSEKDANAKIKEDAPLGDRHNMIFSGCSVTYGTAKAVVCAVGMNTEMGKIAGLLNAEKNPPTPLQQKLSSLGKTLGIIALGACAIVFVVGLLNPDTMTIKDSFMTAVSLAVSAIPEGLPAVITIVLSIGVQRMVKRNAIVKRLPAVETLGSASVICSDKTGTLTQNRMTLQSVFVDGEDEVEKVTSNNSDKARQLLEYATLCCNGTASMENGSVVHLGDPTETSIVAALLKNGVEKTDLMAKYPRIEEIPFDSDRKRMTTICNIDGKVFAIVKGAYDLLALKCIKGNIAKASEVCDQLSEQALRVIGVAYRELSENELNSPLDADTVERDLTFLGLVSMIDPPRDEAKDAVRICKTAGIRAVMITGDHIITAKAIARQIGIFSEGDKAITGAELDAMSDEELISQIRDITVYARVSPINKIRIVKAWQSLDKVVAMTGDGVNDAPALKAADIGCAMGITGTDVAKGAADIILTDDNFATIVEAVKEGRGIYDNIKKVVGFLLGTNLGEIISVFFVVLIWHISPLISIQLLWINLVTDTLPALALGTEGIEKNVMEKLPKPKNEGIFAHGFAFKIILVGILFGVLTILSYAIGTGFVVQGNDHAIGQTMAFITLASSQVFHSFDMRSHTSLLKMNPFSNKNLLFGNIIALGLIFVVLFVPPIAAAFELALLDATQYLIAFGLALIPLVVMEVLKLLKVIK